MKEGSVVGSAAAAVAVETIRVVTTAGVCASIPVNSEKRTPAAAGDNILAAYSNTAYRHRKQRVSAR